MEAVSPSIPSLLDFYQRCCNLYHTADSISEWQAVTEDGLQSRILLYHVVNEKLATWKWCFRGQTITEQMFSKAAPSGGLDCK
jgi:hypothetical protein